MRIAVLCCLAVLALCDSALASPDDDVARGQQALVSRNLVAAMEAFTAALEADPGHGVAAYERGRLLLLIGEPENAIADFTTAIVADPANGRALARRAEAKLVVVREQVWPVDAVAVDKRAVGAARVVQHVAQAVALDARAGATPGCAPP